MRGLSVVVLLLALTYDSSANSCWTTGCNLDNWAQVGCAPFGQVEKSKTQCNGGWIYECCDAGDAGPGNGGGDNGDPGSGQEDVEQITFDQFSNGVTLNGYPAPGRDKYDAFILSAPSRGSIKSRVEAAMSLAQFLHESDGLRAKREYACVENNCVGHYATPECDTPGQFYYGRGYIQLSWCYNYKPASLELFGDDTLVRDPDMVARGEQTSWDTAFWFWKNNVHSQPGVAEGRFGATTRAINGALECYGANRDKAEARYRIYGKVRSAFGLEGPGIEAGCYN